MNEFNLTTDQEKVLQMAGLDMRSRPRGNNMMAAVDGYAGVGKSHMIPHIIQQSTFTNSIIMAPTNKAVGVIKSKLSGHHLTNCSYATLHSIIYGKPSKEGTWIPKYETIDNNLIIVDESSMVTEQVYTDLLKRIRDSYILFIGDSFQLEPVGSPCPIFDLPTTKMTQVVRHDNGILNTANNLRLVQNATVALNDDVVLIDKNLSIRQFAEDIYYGKDAVMICATNNARVAYNKIIRQAIGKKERIDKDPLIAVNNSSEYDNGEIFVGDDMTFIKSRSVEVPGVGKIIIDIYKQGGITFLHVPNLMSASLHTLQFKDLDIATKIDLFGKENIHVATGIVKNVVITTWGYAVSAHKCVDGDTWIITSNGFEQIKDYTKGKVFNGMFLEHPSDFINNGIEETLTLTTNNGYQLKGTKNHRQIIIDGTCTEVKKDFSDLKIGDTVLLPKGSECFGNVVDVFTMSELLPKIMTPEFAEWLGLFVADGCLYKKDRGFRFLKRHKDVVERFAYLTHHLFGIKKDVVPDKYSNSWKIEVNNIKLGKELREYIPALTPHNKFVPKEILTGTKDVQRSFLRGFAEDGSVSLKDRSVEISMKDEKLSIIIHLMFLNLGIVANRHFYKNCFRLTIYSENMTKFKKNVGFISKFKNDRLIEYSRKNSLQSFSILYEIILNISTQNGCTLGSEYNHMKRVKKCTLRLAEKFIKNYADKCSENAAYKRLKCLLDYYTLEVVQTVSLNSATQTYCFEMYGSSRFVQNGIVSGNSQGSQWETVYVDFDYCSQNWNASRWLYTGITRASKKVILLPSKNINFV